MGTRLEFQAVLQDIQDGVSVYFQPPSSVLMSYPAVVYNRDSNLATYADNAIYTNKIRYQVTVIDRDPDSLIPDKVMKLPLSKYVRHFTTEGLYHDIYDVYF